MAFFLATAGLLDGRRAAIHWSVAQELQRRRPAVRVDADAIYVRDGHYWTSAGVTAGMDLALAVAKQDFGHALALEVARDLVKFPKRPGGQSQFSVQLASQSCSTVVCAWCKSGCWRILHSPCRWLCWPPKLP